MNLVTYENVAMIIRELIAPKDATVIAIMNQETTIKI